MERNLDSIIRESKKNLNLKLYFIKLKFLLFYFSQIFLTLI